MTSLGMATSAALPFLALLAIWRRLVRIHGRSGFLYGWLAITVLAYHLRLFILAVGLDGPYPTYLFPSAAETEAAIVRANLTLVLYLGAFLGGCWMFARASFLSAAWPTATRRTSTARLEVIGLGLAAASAALACVLLLRFGGISGSLRAAKQTGELAGWYFLQAIPGMGTIIMTGLAVSRRRRRSTYLALALVCAAATFLFGSRQLVAILGFVLLLSALVRSDSVDQSRRLRRVALAGGLLAAAFIVLSLFRFSMLAGGTATLEGGPVRSISIRSNSISYDALVLGVRDFPDRFEFHGGRDFVAGAAGIVPRALWEEKPADIAPGGAFRRLYEPSTRNGWPSGPVGEWYLNFGLIGVVTGGFISGVVIESGARAYGRSPLSGVNLAIGAAMAVLVVPAGVITQTPTRWFLWAIPLAIVISVARVRQRRSHLPTSRQTSASIVMTRAGSAD